MNGNERKEFIEVTKKPETWLRKVDIESLI